ncbi:MAG TPA: hypothetical protein P5555_06460 [Candidatus Paceibacterota bacterium]|nr:hypothetical protein [Verrucomicrobiota bacterium]HOX01847.1 hypothetical protein [Verrucomicrobiota bacterium]HRZ44815.1 hypothetical protein [Candidatus Paceibacterota bacterium]HRZ94769.1 hypothetical protein [Candidatus Paceibacterota bacterium]
MNADQLVNALLAAARAHPPRDEAPDDFARRIMARVSQQPPPRIPRAWSPTLWHAAAPCLGLMLLVSVWSALASYYLDPDPLLDDHLENTVFAALPNPGEEW